MRNLLIILVLQCICFACGLYKNSFLKDKPVHEILVYTDRTMSDVIFELKKKDRLWTPFRLMLLMYVKYQ
jgi:hypothetical protein